VICSPLRLNLVNGSIKVYYLADRLLKPEMPDLGVEVTWAQVFDIMEDVKRTGAAHRVTNTDVVYLEKDY
jgi:hypothetical protein